MGVNFGSKRTNWDIKTYFFKVKSIFGWEISEFYDFRGKFCDVTSPKLEELLDSNFASGMRSWLY